MIMNTPGSDMARVVALLESINATLLDMSTSEGSSYEVADI
jgi:hypothetical protein